MDGISPMDWREATEIMVERTKHERLRELVADDWPDHQAWRRRIVELAGGEPAKEYPPITTQVGNAIEAAGSAPAAGSGTLEHARRVRRRLSAVPRRSVM